MTATQEIPAEIMAEAHKAVGELMAHPSEAMAPIIARALLARDTAARKDQARKDAEIARADRRSEMAKFSGYKPPFHLVGEQIATAIEATIGGADHG